MAPSPPDESHGSYGPVTSTRPPRIPDNTCNFSHNQQCDERDITAGGQCGSGTDSADCDDSCEFARDGECDDQRGTGACHHGTDSFDCGDDCDGDIPENDCREMHQIGVGGTMAVFIILFLCCMYPFFVYAIAWMTCIRQKRLQGNKPKQDAWVVCALVLVFVVYVLGLGLSDVIPMAIFGFCFGPCCMIIPFMMDECYVDSATGAPPGNRRGAPARPPRVGNTWGTERATPGAPRNRGGIPGRRGQVGIASTTNNPVSQMYVQATPVMATPVMATVVQAQPIQAQPIMATAQAISAQGQPVAIVATVVV